MVIQRAEAAKQASNLTMSNIRDCYRLMLPSMPSSDDVRGDQEHETVDRYDDTAEEGLVNYASRFMARYTPPNASFIKLTPGLQFDVLGALELKEVREHLSRVGA